MNAENRRFQRIRSTSSSTTKGPRRATAAEIKARRDHASGLKAEVDAGFMRGSGSGGVSSWRPNVDSWGGPSATDELAMVPPIWDSSGGGGGGGGGRRGGGGGGASAAAQKAAMQAAYDRALGDTGILHAMYGKELNRLYDPKIINKRYDAAKKGVGSATKTGRSRVNSIYNDQMARNLRAQQAIRDAFAAGQQRLQGIQSGFMANNDATNARLNGSLGAFGAGELQDGNGDRLNQLFGAGQIFNNNLASTFDAAQADRGAIYGAQTQDVLQGMSAEEAAILRQIAVQRANDLRQNDVTRTTAQHENSLGRLKSETDIRLALAQMGLKPGG